MPSLHTKQHMYNSKFILTCSPVIFKMLVRLAVYRRTCKKRDCITICNNTVDTPNKVLLIFLSQPFALNQKQLTVDTSDSSQNVCNLIRFLHIDVTYQIHTYRIESHHR